MKIARNELPDVIISDWMMPGLDGINFCHAVKSGHDTNHIAFIMLTAKASAAHRIEGLHGGADDYIAKPFVAEELLLRVANILQIRKHLQVYFQQQLTITPQDTGSETRHVNNPQQPHPFLEQLYAIIDEHLGDAEFSIDKLATKAAVSSRTLSRKLASIIGLPAAELMKQYRLKKAAEFLKQGMNVTETRYRVGYDSPAHFSAIFKDKYGISPSEYIKA